MKERLREELREIIGDALIILCGCTVLLIVVPVLFKGRYYIFEDNPYILWVEICAGVYIVVFGIRRFIKDLKNGKNR